MLITAVWCPSCLIMRPRYQTLTQKYRDVVLDEIDFDDNPVLIKQHKIGHTLPVAIIFDESQKELVRFVGEMALNKLLETFDKL